MPREISLATPASFAMIQNNATFMAPDHPVSHSKLGLAGVEVRFRQPFTNITVSLNSSGLPFSFFDTDSGTAMGYDRYSIPLNPITMGGPLALKAALYEDYAFTNLRIVSTALQPTTFPGQGTMCISDDPARWTEISTPDEVREVTPNVLFPYRVPQAELIWEYRGQEIFKTNRLQAVATGFDLGFGIGAEPGTTTNIATLTIEGTIQFFNPFAVGSKFFARTPDERQAVAELLGGLRAAAATRARAGRHVNPSGAAAAAAADDDYPPPNVPAAAPPRSGTSTPIITPKTSRKI